MASSTVLRVKRRLEDNPQDALVLVCKRLKTDNANVEISPSLFVFRGTVANEETAHVKSIVAISSKKVKASTNVRDIIEKLRKERKDKATESRYEVVNCFRGLDANEDDQDQIDLVELLQANTKDADADVKCAYDLYVSAKQDFDVAMLDNLLCIEDYQTQLSLPTLYEGDFSDIPEDEDDSNDENNWRNDYPEWDTSSDEEEEMIKAMEKADLDDLSSDAGEEGYYVTPQAEDIARFGLAYAKYRARVLAQNVKNNTSKSEVHPVTDDWEVDSDEGWE